MELFFTSPSNQRVQGTKNWATQKNILSMVNIRNSSPKRMQGKSDHPQLFSPCCGIIRRSAWVRYPNHESNLGGQIFFSINIQQYSFRIVVTIGAISFVFLTSRLHPDITASLASNVNVEGNLFRLYGKYYSHSSFS